MDSELLLCSICSNQPRFSDVSHLLTHVSSKGHLAQLHKLQVKSHQELDATFRLTDYNNWYQQHGLAQLLSERMLQKEAKQASKRTATRRRTAQPKQEVPSAYSDVEQDFPIKQIIKNRTQAKARVSTTRQVGLHQYDNDDGAYASTHAARRLQGIVHHMTPVKQPSLPSSSPPKTEYPDIDPLLIDTPVNPKLKGTIWPGMDLFDAASPLEQRRRNQKKDGSVLKRMERLSKLVFPKEATYSSEWSLKKERHIDDLEDASSLVEGETPIPKPKIRVKRRPLTRAPSTVPRKMTKRSMSPKKQTKHRAARKDTKQARPAYHSDHPRATIPNATRPRLTYSPTADESAEFHVAVDGFQSRKKAGNFTIFDDSPTARQPRVPSYPGHQTSFNHGYGVGTMNMPQRLVYPTTDWLQPQNQASVYLNSPGQFYRSAYSAHLGYRDFDVGKENVPPNAGSDDDTRTTNPLTWASVQSEPASQEQSSESSFGSNSFFGSTSNIADPFGLPKNPLASAFGHLHGEQEEKAPTTAIRSPGVCRPGQFSDEQDNLRSMSE